MVSDFRVIKTGSKQEDIFIYAINVVPAKCVGIAINDLRVHQILADSDGKAFTIAGVRPAVFKDTSGKLQYDSAGQVVITSDWQNIGGRLDSTPQKFSQIAGMFADSHQQIWNVLVDVTKERFK